MSVLWPQMYYSVICRGERVEFHIYGGIHISGLVSDKKMGISLECAEYAYFAIMKKQLEQTFSRVKIETLVTSYVLLSPHIEITL